MGRQRLLWGWRASLTQGQLERWVGASQQDVPGDTNQYLFSSLGTAPTIKLRTAGSGTILLVAAGMTLTVGLLLIYFPAVRHPGVLLGGGVVLACGGLLWPAPSLLAAQAASLGLLLTLGARGLVWILARRRDTRPVIRGAAAGGPDRGSTTLRPLPPEGSSFAATETAPAMLQPPSAEPEP